LGKHDEAAACFLVDGLMACSDDLGKFEFNGKRSGFYPQKESENEQQSSY
jgi:hypothetical protein